MHLPFLLSFIENLKGIKFVCETKTILIGKEEGEIFEISHPPFYFYFYGNLSLYEIELLKTFFSMYQQDILDFFLIDEEFRGFEENLLKISDLMKVFSKISMNLRLESMLKNIQDNLREILNSEGASILLYNKETHQLNFFVTSGGASGKIEKIPVPIDSSIAGLIFKEKKTMYFNDLKNHPFHFKTVDKKSGYSTRNILGTPLFVDEEVVGVLEVVNKINGEFDSRDAEIIELYGNIISNKLLSTKVYEDLSETVKGTILAIATAIDRRDVYTHMHSRNVMEYSTKIGRIMGLKDEKLEELEISALLHDVGKIGIPDSVLKKPGKLTKEEYEMIKMHPIIGMKILMDVEFITKNILMGPLEHHERLDGSGYPFGKKNGEISLIGKIVSVADVFDALRSKRVYKEAIDKSEVIKMMEEEREKFDQKVLDALKIVIEEEKKERV